MTAPHLRRCLAVLVLAPFVAFIAFSALAGCAGDRRESAETGGAPAEPLTADEQIREVQKERQRMRAR
ncbi:MAG: hypothetical protein SFZ24_04525 [Planctomycetota bacterium]|nr:hypothetical protein [Planctomycetota bacterium]